MIRTGKYRILISVVAATTIGLLIALFAPREYTSWTSMVPQVSKPGAKLGNISALAAMAGFNLDLNSNEDLSPSVYPQIIGSVPFQHELMYHPLVLSHSSDPLTLFAYFTELEKKSLSHRIRGIFTKDTKDASIPVVDFGDDTLSSPPIALTRAQDKVRQRIEKRVTLDVDLKNGFITLRSTFRDAALAARVSTYSRELLQAYITRFKIEKANHQLQFIEERYQEKKKEFLIAQENLARFVDQNRNVSTALAAAREEQLRGEYTIALSVYNELAKQLEQAKIQVKEDTPVFSIIQPATVPIKAAKPQKMLTVFVWFFLGLLVGIVWVFGAPYISELFCASDGAEEKETRQSA